jgi:hypothetical protein
MTTTKANEINWICSNFPHRLNYAKMIANNSDKLAFYRAGKKTLFNCSVSKDSPVSDRDKRCYIFMMNRFLIWFHSAAHLFPASDYRKTLDASLSERQRGRPKSNLILVLKLCECQIWNKTNKFNFGGQNYRNVFGKHCNGRNIIQFPISRAFQTFSQ